MKNKRKENILKYMITYEFTYRGKSISPYNYYHTYNEGDYVYYKDIIFKSITDFNIQHDPMSSPFNWEKITRIGPDPLKEQKKKAEMKIIRGDHVGSIFGNNVVIYGDSNGNISADGEKSVVVVFGDVTGNITADRVIRLDNTNTYPEWVQAVKAMTSEKQGDNHV